MPSNPTFVALRKNYSAFCRDVRRDGIFAYCQPLACCQTCMWAELGEFMEEKKWDPMNTQAALSFHDQTWEGAQQSGVLWVYHEISNPELRESILQNLTKHFGTNWEWDGSDQQSIKVWC